MKAKTKADGDDDEEYVVADYLDEDGDDKGDPGIVYAIGIFIVGLVLGSIACHLLGL